MEVDEQGKRTSGQVYCTSGQRVLACEEGLKCTDDPNDSNNGFCRKEGKTFWIINESTLQLIDLQKNLVQICFQPINFNCQMSIFVRKKVNNVDGQVVTVNLMLMGKRLARARSKFNIVKKV